MKPSTVLRDIKNRSHQLKFDFLVFVDVLHLLCQPHGRAICYKLGNANLLTKQLSAALQFTVLLLRIRHYNKI